MKNEFDVPEEQTKNYLKAKEEMEGISVVDLIRTKWLLDELYDAAVFANEKIENRVADEYKETYAFLERVTDYLITNADCPKCGHALYCSDLPQYDYVCPMCDENFNECEVK